MPLRPTLRLLPLTALLASAMAAAQSEPDPSSAAGASDRGAARATLAPVLIEGKADTSAALPRDASSATKTDTPLVETPQSVTVVTREQILDRGATTLQDALNYAAGVRSDAYGLDSRSDSVRIRGAYPDEYVDGLRKAFNYYTSSWRTEPYTLERIEVLRGPSAMLYGQGSTGGVINAVGKRPLAQAQGEFGVVFGSHGRKQVQTDLSGPLTADGQWLYRLVAVGRDADTQVDFVRDDRVVFAPSLTWQPSARTSLTLRALYQDDKSGSTSQFFPWSGIVAPNPNGRLPTERFIGDPDWDRYDTEHRNIGWQFEHRFDDDWSLRQNLRYGRNHVDYRTLYGDSFTAPGDWAGDPVGKRLFGRFADASITNVRMLSVDQHLQGRVDTGPLRHELLVGLDVARYRQTGRSAFALPSYYPGGTVPLIDAYDPVYPDFTPPPFSDMAPSTQRQVGVYLQDQIKFASHWIVSAGLRHDRARNETEGRETEKSHATTKRVGLLYALPIGLSPYLSYSESFTPVANIDDQSFEPLRGKQWEAGVKFEPRGGRYALNAAVYDLREENQLVEVATDAGLRTEQLGETKAKGVELEAKAALAGGVDVSAHYNYTELDDQLEAVPRHQAAVWGKWRFSAAGLDGLSVGAGVRHMSDFNDGAAPTVPSVTLLDALLAWDSPRWRLALNVSNLSDKEYVATCLSRGDCWWGARRNVALSATYRY